MYKYILIIDLISLLIYILTNIYELIRIAFRGCGILITNVHGGCLELVFHVYILT